MKFDISLGMFVLAFIGAFSGWIAWWLNRIRSEKQQINLDRQEAIQKAEIAAEKAVNDRRDFNHLVNNQIEISKNIAFGFKDIESQVRDTNKEIQEIKAYFIRNQN